MGDRGGLRGARRDHAAGAALGAAGAGAPGPPPARRGRRRGGDALARGSAAGIPDGGEYKNEALLRALSVKPEDHGPDHEGNPHDEGWAATMLGLRSKVSSSTDLLEPHLYWGPRPAGQVFVRIGPDEKIAGGSELYSERHLRSITVLRADAPEFELDGSPGAPAPRATRRRRWRGRWTRSARTRTCGIGCWWWAGRRGSWPRARPAARSSAAGSTTCGCWNGWPRSWSSSRSRTRASGRRGRCRTGWADRRKRARSRDLPDSGQRDPHRRARPPGAAHAGGAHGGQRPPRLRGGGRGVRRGDGPDRPVRRRALPRPVPRRRALAGGPGPAHAGALRHRRRRGAGGTGLAPRAGYRRPRAGSPRAWRATSTAWVCAWPRPP